MTNRPLDDVWPIRASDEPIGSTAAALRYVAENAELVMRQLLARHGMEGLTGRQHMLVKALREAGYMRYLDQHIEPHE